MYGNRQRAVYIVCFLGLLWQASGISYGADPLKQLLDSLKPRGSRPTVADATSGATKAVSHTPSSASQVQHTVVNSIGTSDTADQQQAADLWNLPAVRPTHAATELDPQTWMPDPQESSAVRLLNQSDARYTQDTIEALSNVKYPQAGQALDWDPHHQPSAQRYFEALRRTRQARANQQTRSRVTKAHAHTDYGFDLMRRGAVNSAHDEFVEALWSVAYANDARDAAGHVNRLSLALDTLDEADQFASLVRAGNSQTEVSRLASQHRSPAARRVVRYQLDALAAMQLYYEVAQTNLVQAVDGEGIGAEALYGLARSIQQRTNQGMTTTSLAGPRSMALLLAAHQIAPDDPKVSNELGVMYARFGELEKAEKLLKRSLLCQEHAESWHNLSRVWQLAGKDELAIYAQKRTDQLNASGANSVAGQVRFVAVQELSAQGPQPSAPSREESSVAQTASRQEDGQPARVEKMNWLKNIFAKRPSAQDTH